MTTQVIVVNGGSSSGKSGIVRCLQAELPEPWLTAAIDTFVDSLPASLRTTDAGIAFAPDGGVAIGQEFRRLEAAWREGVAATARAGAKVIVDDVFLGGPASQEPWRKALASWTCCGWASAATPRPPKPARSRAATAPEAWPRHRPRRSTAG